MALRKVTPVSPARDINKDNALSCSAARAGAMASSVAFRAAITR
jgi:hypothetical protein